MLLANRPPFKYATLAQKELFVTCDETERHQVAAKIRKSRARKRAFAVGLPLTPSLMQLDIQHTTNKNVRNSLLIRTLILLDD
jgi:hypothetical protein